MVLICCGALDCWVVAFIANRLVVVMFYCAWLCLIWVGFIVSPYCLIVAWLFGFGFGLGFGVLFVWFCCVCCLFRLFIVHL